MVSGMKLALALAILISSAVIAQASCTGQFSAGFVCGNNGGSQGEPTGVSVTSLLDAAFSATQGQILNRGTSVWSTTANPILGVSGVTPGTITLTPGTAPGSPINGQMWTTSAGLFVQINSSTVGPLSAGTPCTLTALSVQYNNAGALGCVAGWTSDGTNLIGSTTALLQWNSDTYLQRDGAANTVAQRNGTNANSLREYNTYSSGGANYERMEFGFNRHANVAAIDVDAGGTGTPRNFGIYIGGTSQWFYGGGSNPTGWTSLGQAYVQQVSNAPSYLMNGGGGVNYGQIGLNSASVDAWALGYGTTPTGWGTKLLTWAATGNLVALPQISTDATHTDATVCEDTTTHGLYFGSGAAGICLGTSGEQFKHGIVPLNVGLSQVLNMQPVSYYLNSDHGDPDKLLYGFTAQREINNLPTLVGRDYSGEPITFDYMGVVPVLVRAVQELNEKLERKDTKQ